MSVWVIVDDSTEVFGEDYETAELVLNKAFSTKESAEKWIFSQEYWWQYEARELEVED